jgi:hypothetical protein
MRRLISLVFVCSTLLAAQAPAGTPFRIERWIPHSTKYSHPMRSWKQLGDRFALTEGPVWIPAAGGQARLSALQRQCGQRHL